MSLFRGEDKHSHLSTRALPVLLFQADPSLEVYLPLSVRSRLCGPSFSSEFTQQMSVEFTVDKPMSLVRDPFMALGPILRITRDFRPRAPSYLRQITLLCLCYRFISQVTKRAVCTPDFEQLYRRADENNIGGGEDGLEGGGPVKMEVS